MKKILLVFLLVFGGWTLLSLPGVSKVPLYFITNKGQVKADVTFYTRASGYTVGITKKALVFDNVSSLVFVNAHKDLEIVPVDITGHKVNYFTGKDRSKWKRNISTSKGVLYKNIYNHIDLKVYGNSTRGFGKQVEYDWIIKPGGNPADIVFQYKNAKAVTIDKEGNLRIETPCGVRVHKKPVSYQRGGGVAAPCGSPIRIPVKFKKIAENTYGFEIGNYDRKCELIIDPAVLAYSTYLGGTETEWATAIAIDSRGAMYITGRSWSYDFPVVNAFQEQSRDFYEDCAEVFVTKFSPDGQSLEYSTYLGGDSDDRSYGIAVDSEGCAYVTGVTRSSDFPTQNPFQAGISGTWHRYDAFVTKLSASGDSLVYSTYIGGGNREDCAYDIAVDSYGNAYITGHTMNTEFPTIHAFQASASFYWNAFVTKFSVSGETLVYSTFLGGSDGWETGHGIAVDHSGCAYVTGYTVSSDFPTVNPIQTKMGGEYNSAVFVSKFSPDGQSLVYSTCLEGTRAEHGHDIAIDSSGSAYITGFTVSPDFPVKNAFQPEYQGDDPNFYRDVFVAKISPGGGELIYSTYLGGEENDEGFGIAVDSSGCAYVTGNTNSTDFPVSKPFQASPPSTFGGPFISMISPTGEKLTFSTYLGGSWLDAADSIVVDNSGWLYVTGTATSENFPLANPYQSVRASPDELSGDAFVSKMIGHIFIKIQASRYIERAWFISRHYGRIELEVNNSAADPVLTYAVYRKESEGQYRLLAEIAVTDIFQDTYTYLDQFLDKNKHYTYQVAALDEDGGILSISNESFAIPLYGCIY